MGLGSPRFSVESMNSSRRATQQQDEKAMVVITKPAEEETKTMMMREKDKEKNKEEDKSPRPVSDVEDDDDDEKKTRATTKEQKDEKASDSKPSLLSPNSANNALTASSNKMSSPENKMESDDASPRFGYRSSVSSSPLNPKIIIPPSSSSGPMSPRSNELSQQDKASTSSPPMASPSLSPASHMESLALVSVVSLCFPSRSQFFLLSPSPLIHSHSLPFICVSGG